MKLENISSNKVFGGWHKQYRHSSQVLQCHMRFAIFLPPQASSDNPVPVLYWLSGLTCTDENFMQKAGAMKVAAELGVAIVATDTSPRGDGVADAESYDLGQGAGFYLNATEQPWADHFRMYDYIVDEIPELIEAHFPVTQDRSIAGHSMGGHGALVIGIKNPSRYKSISAFSPISHPLLCPWGQKAFTAYLGTDRKRWKEYDTCELLQEKRAELPILVDQGDTDEFLEEQLYPQQLVAAAEKHGTDLQLRMQPGYDHSYYYISSFIADHLRFHFDFLKGDSTRK
jgi:S-formylglutathione hydrolase